MYTKRTRNGILFLLLWVDDCYIVYDNPAMYSNLVTLLTSKYKIKELGKVTWLMGMGMTVLKDSIKIDQQTYANSVLNRFNMADCRPSQHPGCSR
jgi:hypothetical protein